MPVGRNYSNIPTQLLSAYVAPQRYRAAGIFSGVPRDIQYGGITDISMAEY